MKNLSQLIIAVILAVLMFLAALKYMDMQKSALEKPIVKSVVKFTITPRTTQLTSEKALIAKAAIAKGDYEAADKIIASVLNNSKIENWHFHPFNIFLEIVAGGYDPLYLAHLNDWVAQEKKSAIPLLVRSLYYYTTGWIVRGEGFVSYSNPSDVASFDQYMDQTFLDAGNAAQRDKKNPMAYYLQLASRKGYDKSLQNKLFNEAIAAYPNYYQLYEQQLFSLTPKWGGSRQEMFDFVEHYTANLKPDSPLKMLWLNLYLNLADDLSNNCEGDLNDHSLTCEFWGAMIFGRVEGKVKEALELYNNTDKYQFNDFFQKKMSHLLAMKGSKPYADKILTLARDIMGQDNYVINSLEGYSDFIQKSYPDAEAHYLKALSAIQIFPFPNEEEKDLTLASTYDALAQVYKEEAQYENVITAENAAIAMNDKGSNYYVVKCYADYQLKNYSQAVQECSLAFAPDDIYFARYWRGRAYEGMQKLDAAIEDLKAVADSENDLKSSAVIELGLIYSNQKRYRDAVDLYNSHSFVFNQGTDSKSQMNIAISYNNRCFDYMNLGELEKALDDCNASLRITYIPQADMKQKQLTALLKEKESGK